MDRPESQDGFLVWPLRFVLGVFAFGGAAIHAASFYAGPTTARLAGLAEVVQISAGVSWCVFGVVLLAVTRRRPSVFFWADVCLVAMGYGMAVLMLGAMLNFVSEWSSSLSIRTIANLQVTIVLASNVVMGAIFISLGRRGGLSFATAIWLWVVGLNGVFAVVSAVLAAVGFGK